MNAAPSGRSAIPWSLVVLGVLALLDLRVELQLLVDHFTWTSLLAVPLAHPLAVAVLVLLPGLWNRCR